MKTRQILLRIILCPFVFLWGIFMLAALTLFPLPILVIFSFFGLILHPFIWLLQKSGSDIQGLPPFCNGNYSDAIGHFIGMTIYIWGAFAVVYVYLKTGKIITTEY